MNILYYQHIKYALIAGLIFALAIIIYDKNYYSWVKKYWFFKRSMVSYCSSLFLILGIACLLFATLDLRGPSEDAKVAIQDQQTIIMLDMSLSMLAEDVRPSRIEKAIVLARHFVKRAFGHQISIVVFSDTQKQVVPFSDDLEFLDTRLSAIAKVGTDLGGSNIKQAIVEAISYFSNTKKGEYGNILVLSDFENQEDFDLTLPREIVLGLVGVGTKEGSAIPIRGTDGRFYRYKTHDNNQVTTRLDKKYMQKLSSEVKTSKIWEINTMDMPTEDMVSFFSKNYEKNLSNRNIKIRPVLGHYLIIAGACLIALASLLGLFKSFATHAFVFCITCILFSGNLWATNQDLKQVYLEKMKDGDLSKKNKLKLAELLLRDKEYEKSDKLFTEVGPKNFSDNQEAILNYITTLLIQKKLDDSSVEMLALNRQLKKSSEKDKGAAEMLNKLRQNVLLLVNANKQENEKKDKPEKNDQKKEDEKKDEEKKNKTGSDQKDDKNKSGGGKDNNKKQNDELKQKQENKENNDQDKNENNKKEESQKDGNKNQSLKEKENLIRQKRNMVSMPTILRQIMDRDKKFQENYLSTKLKNINTKKKRRDW